MTARQIRDAALAASKPAPSMTAEEYKEAWSRRFAAALEIVAEGQRAIRGTRAALGFDRGND